jgi:type II secretory pathway component GspD/PulD (secretin)
MKYSESIQVLDEILFIDPHNPAALALKDIITTSQMYRRYSDVEKRRWEAYSAEAHRALESMVPPRPNISGAGPRSVTGLMEYPEDWPQLSIQRGGAAGYRQSDRDRQTQMDLNKVVSVNFSNNQLDQVINYMKTVTGVDFYPDWKALEGLSIRPEDTISLTLNDVPASIALARILEQLGEDEADRPLYSVEDGVVVVSSDEALRKKKITVVYDIRDLLFDVPMFDNAPEFNLSQSIQQAGGQGGGGGGAGGGGGGFGGGGGGGGFGGGGGGNGGGGGGGGGGNIFGDEGDDPDRRDRQEMIDQLVNIIQTQVDSDGWEENGGATGTLQELNGNLIVTNTPRNHMEIEGLLTQLRAIRALQINIESRLINVSLEWFEQIGIDLDLYFNTNKNMYNAAKAVDPNFQLSDFFYSNQPSNGAFKNGDLKKQVIFDSFAGANDFANTPASGAQFGQPTPGDPTSIQYVTAPVGTPIGRQSGWAPIGVSQDSLSLTNTLATAAVGSVGAAALATPALNMGISYLDDIQVDLIVKATQADQRNVVLTAPRITLFNGQRSWVSVAKAVSFISGLTPVTGDSSGAFQPQVGVVYEGFVLDVEAVISADRRYVTMTVQFGLNENVKFRDVLFSGAAGAGDLVGRGSSTFEATFQLPELEGTEVATTVSVPDKGTILLGGQRKLREFEVETGVPILSKIPIVNRFFTNRVTNKVELTTLLLIRPEVIIQQEDEDKLYPGLRDQLGGGIITQ